MPKLTLTLLFNLTSIPFEIGEQDMKSGAENTWMFSFQRCYLETVVALVWVLVLRSDIPRAFLLMLVARIVDVIGYR